MKIKKYIPVQIIRLYRLFNLIKDFYSDFLRYAFYSATLSYSGKERMEGRIIAHYHVIEKGFTFKDLRLGFGQDMVAGLIDLLTKWQKNFASSNSYQVKVAFSVLEKYFDLHRSNSYALPNKLLEDYTKFINQFNVDTKEPSGSKVIKSEEIKVLAQGDFKSLALSRHSIREFTDEEVSIELLENAVKIAQRSPSVCNRQATKVYLITKKDEISKHLKYQNGNRGFGQKINKLFVITNEVHSYENALERNQAYVDGGIFTMSLLYAIHYSGLGAVSLNWSAESKRDKSYKKFSNIPDSENIITMIGVGNIPSQLKVAVSARKEVSEVLKII